MFVLNIKEDQKIFCNGKFFKVKSHQNFVYLINTTEKNIDNLTIIDVGVVFKFNNYTYKVIRIGNWVGVKRV